MQPMLNLSWIYCANQAESEIAAITGTDLARPGFRSCPLTESWVLVLHKVKDIPDAQAISLGWKWLSDSFSSFVATYLRRDEPGVAAASMQHKQVLLGGQCVGVGLSSCFDAALKDVFSLW